MRILMGSVSLTSGASKSVTLRIPREQLSRMRDECEFKSITLNSSINQIIKDHLDWHCAAAGAKLYYVPRSFLIRVLDGLDNEELDELAQETAKKDLVDISLFLRGGYTIASLFDIAEAWLKISRMSYRRETSSSGLKIIIDHEMGLKYSNLIKKISMYVLEVAFGARSSCDITENTAVITIQEQASSPRSGK